MASSNRANNYHEERARVEMRLAEKKIANGIKELYQIASREIQFNPQGIYTITLDQISLSANLKNLFPNKLKNGVTIHFFNENYISYPHAYYMAQQKIRALIKAAKSIFSNGPDLEEIAMKMELMAQQELEKSFKIFKQSGLPEEDQIAIFHKNTTHILEACFQQTAHELFSHVKDLPENKNLKFSDFAKFILEFASHHRSDTHDILTFNAKTKRFSYDEAAEVTAHDRALGRGTANLSWVFEGTYQETEKVITTKVTSSILKHASPVPIDAIDKDSELSILIDTCKNIQKIAEAMARVRIEGRDPNDKSPLELNWVYLLLTTNALNIEKQAQTYEFITRAGRLLNGHTFHINNIAVTLNCGIMNAGINTLGGKNLLYKGNTQQRQNRYAYMQLTDAVNSLQFHPEFISENNAGRNFLDETFNVLKNALSPMPPQKEQNAELYDAYKRLEILKEKIKANGNYFIENLTLYLQAEQNLQELKDKHEDLTKSQAISKEAVLQSEAAINQQKLILADIENKVQNCIKESESLYGDKDSGIYLAFKKMPWASKTEPTLRSLTDTIEQIERRPHWQKHRVLALRQIQELKSYFNANKGELFERLNNPNTTDSTQEEILTLCALVYKTYADVLYYGEGNKKYEGLYRDPNLAVAFNIYLAAFQRIVGMMGSTGCKSANDRTYVVRVLLSIIENRDLVENPLPEICHDSSLPERVLQQLRDNAMSNSALFSCINDTTAPPKVDGKKFNLLASIPFLKYFSKLGEEAIHKTKIPVATSSSSLSATTASSSPAKFFSNSDSDNEERPLLKSIKSHSELSDDHPHPPEAKM